jgi:hypothetical protein
VCAHHLRDLSNDATSVVTPGYESSYQSERFPQEVFVLARKTKKTRGTDLAEILEGQFSRTQLEQDASRLESKLIELGLSPTEAKRLAGFAREAHIQAAKELRGVSAELDQIEQGSRA